MLLLVSLWSGTRIFGTMQAGVEVQRSPVGPLELGINGKLGDQAGLVPTQTPGRTTGQISPPPPYYGPSQEETRVLAEMQAVAQAASGKDPEYYVSGGKNPAPPLLELPQRALTAYELDQVRKKTANLREIAN